MKLTRFADVNEFYPRVEAFLLEHEAEHNLILGLSSMLKRTDTYRDPYLVSVENGSGIVAVALRTPPFNLTLSEIKDEGAIRLIAEDVYATYGRDLPGVSGKKAVSKTFATLWSSIAEVIPRLNTELRIFRLEKVKPVRNVSGEYRHATLNEYDILVDWWLAFTAEAMEATSREDAEARIESRLEADGSLTGLRLWWDEGKPVSFAGYTGPTPNGIRVGPVYTPPELRGRGYASACVAALSQELLDSGRKFTFLFTDLSNPTSNHIYQMIGYEPVADVDEYRFDGS